MSKDTKELGKLAESVEKEEKVTKEQTDETLKENKIEKIESKSVQNGVIENIKNFIAKIIEMQEKVRQDEEEEKKLEEEEKQEEAKIEEEQENQEIPKYLLEYYDLPFRYNETVVKILAQTPKRLFVYWDISDKDKETYLKAFGENFFNDTYPVLLVHNENKNTTFEISINDFANSWYLDIPYPKDRYTIQLGRKFKSHIKPQINPEIEETNIILHNDYLFIAISNELEVPNDHILFENFKPYVKYRNVKTNEEFTKKLTKTIFKEELEKLYNNLYEGEIDENRFELKNPSSMGTSSSIRKGNF